MHYFWFSTLLLATLAGSNPTQRPNIVYILADDMGWNDVGFTGRSDLQTPNMDALAYHGRILTQHYALPTCTPSRTALLTGKYPIRTGMQGFPLSPSEPRGLPLDQKLMPQYFKELGYQTHLVGKWHLGYHEWKYTPTQRGFDTHFGYFNGFVSYYDHVLKLLGQSGHDFWRDAEPQYGLRGRYVTDLFTEEAVRLIGENSPNPSKGMRQSRAITERVPARQNRTSQPFFLLLSHLAPHAGNEGQELEYLEEDLARFSHIADENRRKYAAMVWRLDQSVGQVVRALEISGSLNNTILVFASDNGAPMDGQQFANNGSNYPLRGQKSNLFEGGIRAVASIWSSQLQQRSLGISNQLFGFVDWFPTLYEAAGGDPSQLSGLDGRSQWTRLSGGAETRSELLLNIDEAEGLEGIRLRNWKLVKGSYAGGKFEGHYGSDTSGAYNLSAVTDSMAGKALATLPRDSGMPLSAPDILQLHEAATTTCSPPSGTDVLCKPMQSACLFDLRVDPCERNNVAAKQPELVSLLSAKLDTYRELLKPQLTISVEGFDPLADPVLHNNSWVPWRGGWPSSSASRAAGVHLTISTCLIMLVTRAEVVIC